MKTKRFKKLKSRKCKHRKCKTKKGKSRKYKHGKCKTRKCKSRKKTRKNNYKKNKKGGDGSCEQDERVLVEADRNGGELDWNMAQPVGSIGMGAYGEVKKFKFIIDTENHSHVAVKEFTGEGASENFLHEKAIIDKLKSKWPTNIVKGIYDDNKKKIIMNIVKGDLLLGKKGGRPPTIELTDIDIQKLINAILEMNISLADVGLFYSDYNLENIYLCKDGDNLMITFLDYGAIFPFVPESAHSTIYNSSYPFLIEYTSEPEFSISTAGSATQENIDWFNEYKYQLALNNTIVGIFNILSVFEHKDSTWKVNDPLYSLSQMRTTMMNDPPKRRYEIEQINNKFSGFPDLKGITDVLFAKLQEIHNFTKPVVKTIEDYKAMLNENKWLKQEKTIEEMVYKRFKELDPKVHDLPT